jgi:hypothetical protein
MHKKNKNKNLQGKLSLENHPTASTALVQALQSRH